MARVPLRGELGGSLSGVSQLSEIERGVTKMASKELEATSTVYIMAGVGAVILGGLAAAALGGLQNTIAAAVVGGLAGACLGLFL